MESGEVPCTKAREFAPYIEPKDQEAWIEFARQNTNRAVEQRVGKWNVERQGRSTWRRRR